MITKDIDRAIRSLQHDDLVAIPTETVYGLAGNAQSEHAIKKIYHLKNRPLYNPLIVHIGSAGYLPEIAQHIPETAFELARKFWPGPLTLLLEKKSCIPGLVTAGKKTVAVRVPDHPLTLQLLNKLSFPLAAPSANPFGSISPTCAAHVHNYFGHALPVILDGGNCAKGIESTIIGFRDQQAVLYRHGSIAAEEIESITGKLSSTTHAAEAPEAPGMLLRHYAPNTNMYLVTNIPACLKKFEGKRTGLLVFTKRIESDEPLQQEVLSETGDLAEAAKNLYAAMHRLDNSKLDVIIAERLPDTGLGKTINDKLERATKK